MIHRPYAIFSDRIGIKKIVSIRVGIGIVDLSGKDFDLYPLGLRKLEEIRIFHPNRERQHSSAFAVHDPCGSHQD